MFTSGLVARSREWRVCARHRSYRKPLYEILLTGTPRPEITVPEFPGDVSDVLEAIVPGLGPDRRLSIVSDVRIESLNGKDKS